MAASQDERTAMESMDHEQALALLGLSGTPQADDIEAQYAQRRRLLERRWVTSHSDLEKRVLEAQMRELDAAREAALNEQQRPAGLPPGAGVELKIGAVLADRYAVRAKIGYGPRAAVYRALDLTWGKEVALKVFAGQLMLVPGASKRLAEAIRPTFGFAHSGIVNTYGMIETGAQTMIAMEFVDGRPLSESAVPSGWSHPKSAADILRVIEQVAEALIYAEPKTLHLNLSPQNIFMIGGKARVADFMMSQAVPVLAAARSADPTAAAYAAPEVLALAYSETPDFTAVDSRADQYSLAAVAYVMATGTAPDAGRRPLGALRPDLAPEFTAAVERALALAPEARFNTHGDFIAALSATPRRLPRLLNRLAAGVIVAGLALMAVAGLRQGDGLLNLTGTREVASTQRQAQALQERTALLRGALVEAQRNLQRRGMDARLALNADKNSTDAKRTVSMLQALSDLVTPGIFNHPDVLNAYNLAGLGDEHIARARHAEAVAVLTTAEAVLTAKVYDLRQAELLIERQFGGSLPTLGAQAKSARPEDKAEQVKQDWLAAVTQRRRFAEALEQDLVLIPAGAFSMGDLAGNGARSEQPVREVAVAAFKLGRTEVTQAQYAACAAEGACAAVVPKAAGEDLPVSGLSWLDAQAYVDWLRVKTGEDYRLPSEAEWEYAARAGAATPYAWGASPGRGLANCLDCASVWDGAQPAPVASFKANSFGLFDMTGNVWEWTADCWYRDYTSAPPTSSPRDGGAACEKRVLRGGSWDNAAWLARVSYRAFAPAATPHELYGFRIAKSVE